MSSQYDSDDRPPQQRVTDDIGHAVMDIPHNPDAEAALVQETRERLAMLQRHVGSPEAVASLEQLDEDLEAIMYTIARTDKYECGCSLIKDDR